MFTKKYLKEDYDKNFEEFISSDFSKKSFNDYLYSDIAHKKKKASSQNFWNDDDENTSSSIQLGTGNKFLKSSKPSQAPKNTKHSNVNIPNTVVKETEDEPGSFELRLNLNESTDKSLDKSSFLINEDPIKNGPHAHPMTFEGITDTIFDRSYSPTLEGDSNNNINKPYVGSETIKSNILTIPIDKSRENFIQSLDRTDKEHLLSKVSLLDSYDGHKLSKPDELESTGFLENDNQKLDESNEYMYKNSFNPASGDNFNTTQAITNVTDTVIGDTTAADFAALHKQFEKYNNKESFEFNPETNVPLSETIKDLYEEKSNQFDDFSKLNLESTINSKSFGLRIIHPDHEESKSSPVPTPRPRTKNKVSKSDNTEMEIIKDDSVISNGERNSETNEKPQSKRYSHVKSSGYGSQSVTPPNKTSVQNSSKSQPVSVRKKSGQQHNKPSSRSSTKSEGNVRSRSKSVPRNDDIIDQNYPTHIKNQTYFIPKNQFDESFENSPIKQFSGHVDHNSREWQEKWLEERKIVKKLQADSSIQERDVRRQIESITQKYEEKISNLQSQLNRAKQQLQMKPDFNDKLLGPNVTKDDISRIEREMKDQNLILAAYEKDNEKLHQEIKILKQHKKGEDMIDSMENERLISQIVSLKAELDSKEIELRNMKQIAKENKLLNTTGILENKDFHFEQIVEMKNELQNLNQKYIHSESERQKADKKLDIMLLDAEKRLSQCKHELEIERTEMEKLKESHKIEVGDLKRKIKWYLENQSILDQNEKKLKIKDNEIAELKHLLGASNSIKISSNIRAKEKLIETEKVKQLENEIMSLKTDLYSLVKGKNIGNVAEKRTIQFLEDKIKSLESDCDVASKKENNSFRSLQQQFEAMKFQYEEKIRDLELDLVRKIDNKSQPEKQTRITDLRANVEVLNKELEKKSTTINKLKLEIKKLNKNTNEQLQNENKLKHVRKVEMNNRTEMLQLALKEKENEVHRLETQNNVLRNNEQRSSETNYSPSLLELQAENANCKSQIIHLTQEINNYRQAIEDIRMSALKNEEFIREECRSEIRKCEEFHKENMHNVKMDYANRHSDSEIANLQSQIEVQKNYISHLQGQITEFNVKLANIDTKSNELTEANKEIHNLKTELADLRLIWSKKPGLEMIDRLRAKIGQLEEKENFRGRQLDEYVEKVVKNNSKQYQDEVERWRAIVVKKNQNLIHVQRELDHLLEALEELRRQGIVIPKLSLRSNPINNQKFL